MTKRTLLILSVLFYAATCAGQARDTTILLPNRLVVSQIKNPSNRVILDTNGTISLICLSKSDSLIFSQVREIAGRLVYFTDSSLVLHTELESIQTQLRNGSLENEYYWASEDSLKNRYDTIRFSDIRSISYDSGRFRQVRGILQSTAYLYILGNIAVLVAAFVVPKKYGNLVSGQNATITTGAALTAGAVSFFFTPKEFRLANDPRPKRRIRWKIEVI